MEHQGYVHPPRYEIEKICNVILSILTNTRSSPRPEVRCQSVLFRALQPGPVPLPPHQICQSSALNITLYQTIIEQDETLRRFTIQRMCVTKHQKI